MSGFEPLLKSAKEVPVLCCFMYKKVETHCTEHLATLAVFPEAKAKDWANEVLIGSRRSCILLPSGSKSMSFGTCKQILNPNTIHQSRSEASLMTHDMKNVGTLEGNHEPEDLSSI